MLNKPWLADSQNLKKAEAPVQKEGIIKYIKIWPKFGVPVNGRKQVFRGPGFSGSQHLVAPFFLS